LLGVFCFPKIPELFQLEGGFEKQKNKARFFGVVKGFHTCIGYLLGITFSVIPYAPQKETFIIA